MNFTTIITQDFRPFVPLLRCGAIASSAISTAGNLAATTATNVANKFIADSVNSTNARNVDKTNEANLQISRERNEAEIDMANEANALNYKMFQEQNAFNENMWEKENAYNDPSSQMERLINAGINPNMLGASGGNGSSNPSGVASAAPQSGSPIPQIVPDLSVAQMQAAIANPVQMLPFSLDFLGPLSQATNIEKERAITHGLEIDNRMKGLELQNLPTDIAYRNSLNKWAEDTAKAQVFDLYASGYLKQAQVTREEAETYFKIRYSNLVEKQAIEVEQRTEFARKMQPKQLRQMDADYSKTLQEIKTQQAQEYEAYASASNMQAQADLASSEANLNNIDAQTRHEQNLQGIRESQARELYQKILGWCEASKIPQDNREVIADYLVNHDGSTPSQVFSAIKDASSMDEQALSKKYGWELARFGIGVACGVIAGVVTANPAIGLGVGAAVAGSPVGAVVNPSSGQSRPVVSGFNR